MPLTLPPTRPSHGARTALVLAGLLALGGCGAGDRPLADVDPDAVPSHPTYDQAFAIVQRECAPCHDDGGTEPRYDTCETVLQNAYGLRSTVFGSNTMPPGAWPRLSSEERLVIQRWLDQGLVAPCN